MPACLNWNPNVMSNEICQETLLYSLSFLASNQKLVCVPCEYLFVGYLRDKFFYEIKFEKKEEIKCDFFFKY